MSLLIDTQHQRLFQLIEELRLSFFMKKSEMFVEKTLKGLMSYCMEHFESEELMLQTVGYPVLDSHANLHRLFEAQARAWFADFEKGVLDEEDMIRTLVDWLVTHVMTSDVAYANYCKQKGFDMSQIYVVSDLADFMEREIEQSVHFRIELVLVILLLPSLIFLCLFAFWNPDPIRIGLGVAAAVVECLLGILIIIYVNQQINLRIRTMRAPYARRLAENLLAGEIAARIAVLDLDNIEALFQNVEGSLVQCMKDICEHVQMYLPYLPTTVLALIRTGEKEEEEAQSTVLSQMGITVVATGRKSARPTGRAGDQISGRASTIPTLTDVSSELNTNRSSTDEGGFSHRLPNGGGNSLSNLDNQISARGSGLTAPSTQRGSGAAGNKHLLVNSLAVPGNTHRSQVSGGDATGRTGGTATGRKKSFMKYSTDFGASAATNRSANKPSTMSSGTKDMLDRWLSKKSISVLVTEITGFEQSANTMSSAELIELHSKYVVLVQEMSKTTRGVFQSLMGDRVVITWNAANNIGNHAEQACNAALSMRDTLAKNKDFLGRKLHSAVASGMAYVGNMGSKTKLSFSILGTVPALAEALCQLNLYLRTEILISPQTWKDVSNMFCGKLITPIELLTPTTRSSTTSRSSAGGVVSSNLQFASSESTVPATLEASDLIFGDAIPSPTHQQQQHGGGGGDGNAGTAPPVVSPNMLIIIELKQAISSESDEWMYQLQDASNKDPFKQYNEAAKNLMNGIKQEIALTQLKEYVDGNLDDVSAREFYKSCLAAVKRNQLVSSLIWRHGWAPPLTTFS